MSDPRTDLVRRLRKVAEAATPGPWGQGCFPGIDRRDNRVYGRMHEGGPWPKVLEADMEFEDALHVATFDPPTVLALLEVVEAAEKVEADGGDHFSYLDRAMARLREVAS